MKKMIVIICILLIIFISMFWEQKIRIKNTTVTADEVNQIQQLVNQLYLWKEITGKALPEFSEINQAPEQWIWEVVKKNLEQYQLSYEQIQEKANEIFGEEFKKIFPKEGTDFLVFDEKTQSYLATEIELDQQEDCFFINQIQKQSKEFEVYIIEYLEDYSQVRLTDQNQEQGNIILRNLDGQEIESLPNTTNETKVIEIVKEKQSQFTYKKLLVEEKEGAYFIKQVSQN